MFYSHHFCGSGGSGGGSGIGGIGGSGGSGIGGSGGSGIGGSGGSSGGGETKPSFSASPLFTAPAPISASPFFGCATASL